MTNASAPELEDKRQVSFIKTIQICGFRGFSINETLHFAAPSGEKGSGLTVIVGPNNSGKSSIIEALTAVSHPGNQPPTFSEGKRNSSANSRVKISLSGNRIQHMVY